SRQVPLMYGILVVNSLVLAATHPQAPPLLRLYIPGILTLICLSRIALWWGTRRQELAHKQARRLLFSTVFLSATLGFGFAAWALSLYSYGDAYQQSHVAFYLGITSICCVFCLMHVRGAATMVALC